VRIKVKLIVSEVTAALSFNYTCLIHEIFYSWIVRRDIMLCRYEKDSKQEGQNKLKRKDAAETGNTAELEETG
jgi:hypothetical protein